MDEQPYSVPNLAQNGHTNQVFWIKGQPLDGDAEWIEVGFGRGWYSQNVEVFYWASNDKGGYAQSLLQPPTQRGRGTYHVYEIAFDGTEWRVRVDGFLQAVRMNRYPMIATELNVGLEATDRSALVPQTSPRTFEWLDAGGTWQSWDPNLVGSVSDPPFTWTWQHRGSNAVFQS